MENLFVTTFSSFTESKMRNYSEEIDEECNDFCIEDWVGFILEGILILIISIFGIIGKGIERPILLFL